MLMSCCSVRSQNGLAALRAATTRQAEVRGRFVPAEWGSVGCQFITQLQLAAHSLVVPFD